jgi:antitoxin component YwqK of YwqJK toxin-antitoxin module
MKIKLTLFLFCFVATYSCQFIPKKTNQVQDEPDSISIHKTYYEKSGVLKSEITVKNKRKNGPAKEYYPTGELRTLVYYVNNIKEGETIWYYMNGKPYRVTQYVNGQMEGIRKLYYESGKIKAEIPYHKGEPVEGLKEYKTDGALITNYPDIVFTTKNNLLVDNTYSVICRMSNNSKNVKFYQEINNTKNNKRLLEVTTKNGIANIKFNIPSRVKIDKEIIVHAKLKSSLGNPYLIHDTFHLKVDTR